MEKVTKKPDIDFSYRFNNDRYYASIVLVLKTGDGVCKGVTEEKAREIARQIFEDGETTEKNFFATWKNLSIEYDDKQVENTTYNGICKDFRNKEYNNKFQDFQDLYQQYQVQGKVTNFDYCNHQFVDYNYSEDDVVLMIENALIGTYGATTDTESSSGENFEVTEEDVRPDNDKDISDGYKLQCSPNNVYNSKDTDYYVNKRTYFYQKETKVNNKCTQTCKEKVTVEYGPPVATKAGMCFEYKVKVKSKVNCKTKFTGTPPNSSDYKLCNVYPYCNNGDHYYQAGPEEEFDNCISKCDKGKYTQSCINKCYKKVYEDSNTLDVNYNTKNIAQNNLPSLDINCNSLTSDAERISDYVKTKEYKEKYFYKLENGKIIWTGRKPIFLDRFRCLVSYSPKNKCNY